jgi:phenylalanyl-tRNA synthetase alpha chain
MPAYIDELNQIEDSGRREIDQAASAEELEALRLTLLGRKDGRLTRVLHALPELPPDERKEVGRRANQLKILLEETFERKKRSFQDAELDRTLSRRDIDLTLPPTPVPRGGIHPLTRVMDEIVAVFSRLGFGVADGPEIETDFNNFTAMNHPPDHPARDAHDTFYVKNFSDADGTPLLLRTHTSPVQIRYMKERKPPFHIVVPGRVFRHEAVDATHSFVFHQVEGLAVGEDIALSDLKGVLSLFAREVFGPAAEVRFRPSYFPFVEPGIEVDIRCTLCEGKGCSVCKRTGWLEMLGAGMVHPNVFRAVGYDPRKVTGYAFGIGVERVAMFKYGVDDMRLFFENDLRFLRQF